jgi:integrase/recombinase XerD
MELYDIRRGEKQIVVLLDDKMRIIKPVFDYMKFLMLKDRSENTIKAYGLDLKIYWQFLEIRRYDYKEVSVNTIGEFKEYLMSGTYDENITYYNDISKRTGKTINRILNTIYNFYKYCAMVLDIDNPILMETINRPFDMFKGLLYHTRPNNKTNRSIFKVKESSRQIKLITQEDAHMFLESLSTLRDKLIFKILYLSGARIGEVLELKIEDIPCPESSKQIAVLRNIKSKGKRRDLYIPMSLLEELDNFIMEERNYIDTEHSYIFVSKQPQQLGKHLTYRGVYEVFNNVKRKTNIIFNFHDLRHTHITALIESGMDISVVKIIAGHKHIQTTQNYTHLSNKYIESSLNRYWAKSSLIGIEENV